MSCFRARGKVFLTGFCYLVSWRWPARKAQTEGNMRHCVILFAAVLAASIVLYTAEAAIHWLGLI
jgi:hypothetical protein